MSDVTITFSGDDKDSRKVFERMQRDIAKLKEKISDLGKVQKKAMGDAVAAAMKAKQAMQEAGEAQQSLWSKGKAGLIGQVKGLLSVERAVDFVTASYDRWDEKMKAIGERAEKFSGHLLKSLGRAGDLSRGDEIKGRLRGMVGVKQEEALTAFDAISGSAPQTNLDRRLALTGQIAKLAPIADVGQLGGTAGELSDLMPGAKPEDIADLVLKLREQVGGDESKLSSPRFLRGAQLLSSTGATDMHGALAFGAEALRQNMDSRLVEGVATSIGSQEALHKGETLSGDQRKQNKAWKAADAKERFRLLQTDAGMREAALGEKNSAGFAQLSPESVARMAGEQKAAMAGTYAADQLALAGKVDPQTMAQRAAEVTQERSERTVEAAARGAKRENTLFTAYQANKGPVTAAINSAVGYTASVVAATAGFDAETAAGAGRAVGTQGALGKDLGRSANNDIRAFLQRTANASESLAKNAGKKAPPPGNAER